MFCYKQYADWGGRITVLSFVYVLTLSLEITRALSGTKTVFSLHLPWFLSVPHKSDLFSFNLMEGQSGMFATVSLRRWRLFPACILSHPFGLKFSPCFLSFLPFTFSFLCFSFFSCRPDRRFPVGITVSLMVYFFSL